MDGFDPALFCVCVCGRDAAGNVEVMQLDFEMENFTSLSVTRRINWNIDYKGQGPSPDSEKVVTELTVVQRDIQAIIPLAMVSGRGWGGGGWVGQIYADLLISDQSVPLTFFFLPPGL